MYIRASKQRAACAQGARLSLLASGETRMSLVHRTYSSNLLSGHGIFSYAIFVGTALYRSVNFVFQTRLLGSIDAC